MGNCLPGLGNRCLAISSSWKEHSCESNVQCAAGTWGKYSQCSSAGKCRCSSGKTTVDGEAILYDGVCYLNKTIGDFCQEYKECAVPIKGGVYCKNENDLIHTGNGTCQCRDTHLWYPPMHECLRKSTGIKDDCIISEQCSEAGLGKYSRCNPDTNQCECYGEGYGDTLYHNVMKKCFPRRMFNETCEDHDECRASLGPKAKCGANEENPDKMVCHHDEGDSPSTIPYKNEEMEPGYPIEVIVGEFALVGVVFFHISSGAVICTLAIVGILLLTFYLGRRRRSRIDDRKKRIHIRMEENAAVESLLPGKTVFEDTCSNYSIPVYSTEDITSMSLAGEGCFGQVFKGTLNGALIAVKKIKSEHYSEIIREIETVAQFTHPNILPLLGVTKNSELESPWLLFEFMEHGDLAGVLRNDNFKPVSSQGMDMTSATMETSFGRPILQLSNETLLSMASQIAEGMKCLASHHLIHRDLAARNCLVGATGVIKISDFGLSRDVYAGDYYRSSGNKMLPIRWMAPESIGYGNFTSESDIWSYGILLWEMYSFGMQPYFGLSFDDVMDRIKKCILLTPPENCPPFIQELMSACWMKEPKNRPTFAQICVTFSTLRKDAEKEEMSASEYLVPRPANLPEYFQVAEK